MGRLLGFSRGPALVASLGLAVLGAGAMAPASAAAGSSSEDRGTGIGTRAALSGPDCDAATGKLRFPSFTASPPCVRPWPAGKNNGGATSPGVSATSIKVVVLAPNEQQQASLRRLGIAPKNVATGQAGTTEDNVRDTAAVYEHIFEEYGRAVSFEFVTSAGSDEAAQHADALEVIAKKPFAVLQVGGGGSAFAAAVTAGKIVVITQLGSKTEVLAQAPYRWIPFEDLNAEAILAAEFVAKSLAGRPAKWAGDAGMRTQRRKFGVVYPQSEAGVDIDAFNKQLARYGAGKAAIEVSYAPATGEDLGNASFYQEVAPTFVAKLKAAGVTTVIDLADNPMTASLTNAATSQDFHPEWVVPGTGSVTIDFDARTYDQDQWAHAFGLSILPPAAESAPNYGMIPFQWYWGTGRGTFETTMTAFQNVLFDGIHMAGPKLTPQTFQAGLFAMPAAGGAASGQVLTLMTGWGPNAKLPYPSHFGVGLDVALVWYDPTATGPSNIFPLDGTGKYSYLAAAKRYKAGQLPKGEPKFFDPSVSTLRLTSVPAADQPPEYPCTGCPGATGAS